jgi:hypothetical protein
MRRRRRFVRTKREPRRFSVYVIQLSREAVAEPCALAPVYVGQTAHSPEHRFEQHKAGGLLSAGKAHRFGVKLRPDLTAGIGPFTTRAEAERAEQTLAEALERQGRKVFWG